MKDENYMIIARFLLWLVLLVIVGLLLDMFLPGLFGRLDALKIF